MKTYIIGYLGIRTLDDKIVRVIDCPENVLVIPDGDINKPFGKASNFRLRSHLILADTDFEIPEGHKVTFGGQDFGNGFFGIKHLLTAPEWAWGDLPNSLDEFNQKCCTLCNYTACMYDCNTPVARVEN